MPSSKHILNPDHLPDLIEPRALPLVKAMEAAGAQVFASCAGHEASAWQRLVSKGDLLEWPHFAFRCSQELAGEISRFLLDGTKADGPLNYFWQLVGYHVPRFDFQIAYAFRIRPGRKQPYAREKLLDSDFAWISDQLRNRPITAVTALASRPLAIDASVLR